MPLPAPPDQLAGLNHQREQHWPWWPLLPLYPYGRRRTLVRELLPGRLWSFEQLHGVWYVAVPIRMTVLKVGEGLMLYAPLPPTGEVVATLRHLEQEHGPVHTLVLATASGLEHKLPVPAMARAFPRATLWVTDHQWSFPLQLPPGWLGFPRERTKVLGRDGLPHPQQLSWIPLGPLDLGLGPFLEVACLDQATGALLVTDALGTIQATPPHLFADEPTPRRFHARESGAEPLIDTEANRRKGWKRIVLFANYFRPACISVPEPSTILANMFAKGCRDSRSHFGFYPFRWAADWETEADRFLGQETGRLPCRLAPVLERLVFPRAQNRFLAWLDDLSRQQPISQLISAHYHAPQPLKREDLAHYGEVLRQRDWAPSEGSWQTLAAIDQTLLRLGVVGEKT
ncbi:MAG: DUF4336 domain-containing protein [Cyanobacteriota bacterium]